MGSHPQPPGHLGQLHTPVGHQEKAKAVNPKEIKLTSALISTSVVAPPRVPQAARTLAPTAAATDTLFSVVFNVLNRKNSGSSNAPTQQKEERQENTVEDETKCAENDVQ